LLETDLTRRLAELARENGCTLFIASYAVLLALLHGASGETDIAISTQVTGRDDVEIERTVGTFVNTIPLRADLRDDPTFVEVLERVCDVVSDAFELRHVPTEALVEIVNPTRDPSRSSLFSVNFIFQRSFVKNATYDRFRLVDLPSRSAGAIYDLCFFMVERPEGWRISCEYNLDLFEGRTIDGLIARFPDIVRAVVVDPTRRLSEFEFSNDTYERGDRTTSLEVVREFVSTLLGHDRFEARDDIFANGFDSLLALRLVAKIKAWNGVELPLRSLFEDRSVMEIARRVDDLKRGAVVPPSGAEPVVTLNAQGTRRPFVFLHSDLFAQGLYCKHLAAAMPDQPIHALAPHGTAGLPLLPTIEAMALDYLSRIRAVQPQGPYRIGGFCVSGLVAFEFARLLEEAGEIVERLVLVNASALPRRSIPPFDRLLRWIGLDARIDPERRTALCYNLARLHAALAQGPKAALRLVLERMSLLFGRATSGSQDDQVAPFEERRGARNIENSLGHVVAAFTYHPKRFAGALTLLWGSGQHIEADVPAKAWKAVARSVRTVSVPGGHIGLLNERVQDLARALDAVLSE
jgi:thioesterase domain-containing protein/acyl carrier protein